jgi:hypothetical protein
VIRGTLAGIVAAPLLAAPAGAAQSYDVSFHAFALPGGGISFSTAPIGSWTSPWFATGFGFPDGFVSIPTSTSTGTGGIVYAIDPASVPPPPSPGGNW